MPPYRIPQFEKWKWQIELYSICQDELGKLLARNGILRIATPLPFPEHARFELPVERWYQWPDDLDWTFESFTASIIRKLPGQEARRQRVERQRARGHLGLWLGWLEEYFREDGCTLRIERTAAFVTRSSQGLLVLFWEVEGSEW